MEPSVLSDFRGSEAPHKLSLPKLITPVIFRGVNVPNTPEAPQTLPCAQRMI